MNNVNLKKIYEVFFGKKLIELTKIASDIISNIPNQPNKPNQPNQLPLTPVSKAIYDKTSPRSKPYILQEMLADDTLIDEKLDLLDPDYQEKMENSGLGFFMENFVAMYCHCPVCGKQTLKKYAHSNVPVVDLVCTNKSYHLANNKCFLFQVKISLTSNYFSLANKKIIVGSKTYGELVNQTKGTNSIYQKIIVPGYICIRLYKADPTLQIYSIDHRNSFIIVPNYQNESDKLYYKYLDEPGLYGKNVITWDNSMVDTLPFNKITSINKIDYEVFTEVEISNPYANLIDKIAVVKKLVF